MVHVTFLRTGNEIGLSDKIGRSNRQLAKAQMAHSYAAGFFRVVSKIGLRVKVGIVADNFYSRFICANSAVRAEPPELTSGRSFGRQVNVMMTIRERFKRHVVFNADCETVHGRIFLEFFKDG